MEKVDTVVTAPGAPGPATAVAAQRHSKNPPPRHGYPEHYLRELSRYTPVDRERESRLATRIRRGDQRAVDELVNANLRFVVSVARQYEHQGMELADLINEGNHGLIRAARRFDERKGFKFISYAVWWIRQAILQALARQSRITRIPEHRVEILHRIKRAQSRLEQTLGRPVDAEEVGAALKVAPKYVHLAARYAARHASLDAVVREGGPTLLSTIEDRGSPAPDAALELGSTARAVKRILQTLDREERTVLRLYYGIGHDTAYSLRQIGNRYGLRRERVRRIRDHAIGKLRACGDVAALARELTRV